MNELMLFNYSDTYSLRTVVINGDPWFVAKDVCDILGIKNVSDSLKNIDEEDKGIAKTDTLGGTQRLTVINESGLYMLIMRSNKPEAKPFQRWVTREVLPTIRKTGSYSVKPKSREDILADAVLVAQEVIAEKDGQIAELTYENADLKDTLGEGETYKRARSIPWILDYFKKPKKGSDVYAALGKRLTLLSEEFGYACHSVKDPSYPQPVNTYHVDVIEVLKMRLDANPGLMRKYRKENS